MRNLNKIDVMAGLFVIVIGCLSLRQAMTITMGTARSMGPGYFPYYIGIFMLAIGVGIIIEGRKPASEALEYGQLPRVRSLLLILAAVFCFALLIERVGMLPAVAAAVFIGSLADPNSPMLQKLILTVVVPIVCVAIFKVGLGMTVDVVRWRP